MSDPNNQAAPALPTEIAQRMKAIIDRHSEEYRRDLPKVFECMNNHASQIHDPAKWQEAMPLLKREAHDMKGQAATFGLPSLSVVSQSLCRLLDYGKREHADYPEIVKLHVSALKRLADREDPALIDQIKREAARMGVVTK